MSDELDPRYVPTEKFLDWLVDVNKRLLKAEHDIEYLKRKVTKAGGESE